MIPMDMGIMDLLDLYKYKNKRLSLIHIYTSGAFNVRDLWMESHRIIQYAV